LTRDLEGIGSNYSVSAGREHLQFSADVLPDKVDELLPIFAEVLQPVIEEYQLRYEKDNIEVLTKEALENPVIRIFEELHGDAFRHKGLGLPLYPPLYNIHHIEPDTLNTFVRQNYTTSRTVLVAVGGISHEKILDRASKVFAAIPKGSEVPKVASKYSGGEGRVLADASGTHVAIGFQGAGYNDKDIHALGVLQFLLGGGKLMNKWSRRRLRFATK